MKRILALVSWVILFASVSPTWGDDARSYGPTPGASWVFNRSYYSHEPASPVRIGQRATGGPYYSRPTGSYVNSGWRWNRSTINVGGQVYDNVNIIESWVQSGGQF